MGGANFNRLNERCVARILSFTSPRDVCRLSAVSRKFRAAAESEAPWEKFLPSDWWKLLPRSISALHFTSKKELFFRLCKPILIDDGNRSLWLEKSSGKKCCMVSARGIMISWGDDERQWKPTVDSCIFPEVAELIHVWWFDLRGTIDMADLSPNTMYAVSFLVRHTPDHYGWMHLPIVLSLQLENDPQIHEQTVFICPNQKGSALQPSKDYDGWMHVKVGEFFCDADGGEVMFRMHEVDYYKGGIVVMGVEIRPCGDQEREESNIQREHSNGEEDSEEFASLCFSRCFN